MGKVIPVHDEDGPTKLDVSTAATPAGRDLAGAKGPLFGRDTDAPFATEVQSFLPLGRSEA
jgi:hypothetical protein